MRRWLFSLVVLACVVAVPAAAERRLFWRELAVEARLDADGRLHVSELHAMVFDGDWNGGERSFDLRPGQKLVVDGVTRIDPGSGVRRDLIEGDLDTMDAFRRVDRKTLRWRLRRPDDPPFVATEVVTEIRYTLDRVLVVDDSESLLDHQFAMPAAEWPVRRCTVKLEIDPAWSTTTLMPVRVETTDLAPGEGVRVRVPLHRVASGRPAAVLFPPPLEVSVALLLATALVAVIGFARLIRKEERPGRWPGLDKVAVDSARVEATLLAIPPEVAGAMWDRSVGAPEVAATLARLVASGVLASRVRGKVMELELRLERGSLHGYDAELVDALFLDGTVTDSEKVKAHYKDSGFDPAALLRPGLEARVDEVLGPPPPPVSGGSWQIPAALVAAAVVLLLAGGALNPWAWPTVGIGAFAILFTWGWAAAIASVIANSVSGLAWKLVSGVAIMVCTTAAFGWLIFTRRPVGLLVLAGLAAGLAALWIAALGLMRARDRGTALVRRRELAALRAAFRRELAKPTPALADAWFPWIVALGLGTDAERWAKRFGASAASLGGDVGSGGSASPSGSSPGWSGGGGSFGGAGASAGWAAAAGGMAAGVASASSSSSGGGSSGGGGGGGW